MAAITRKRPRSQNLTVGEAADLVTGNNELDYIPSGSDDKNLSEDELEGEFDENYEVDDGGDAESSEDEQCLNDEDYSNDESDEQPLNSKSARIWHWVKKDLPQHVNPENHLIPQGLAVGAKTPLDMFLAHFGDEAFELLMVESNRYMQQLGRSRPKQITLQEIRIFLGICFYMSVVSLPNRRMYWSPKTRQAVVADVMTINRFEEILSCFHANDNELMKNKGDQGYDRLHKVRPLIEIVSDRFQECADPELFVAVDEQIIPFKGRHSLKVYMKKKPKKWGYKIWALAGHSGYIHKFYFAGDNTVPSLHENLVKSVGKGGEVVLQLTEGLAQNSYVFFDNYFASPELLAELRQRNINATCTIQANRTRKCPLLNKKEISKKGRGAYDYRLAKNDGVLICEWFDNKPVMVASNVHSVEPTYQVRRYDRKAKKHINVQCPRLISDYNAHMGGVDKCDMLLAFYRNVLKTKKWYKRIIFHLLDLCVVNSWLLYRLVIPDCQMPLVDFKVEVAKALILQRVADVEYVAPTHGQKIHSARDVNKSARFDLVDHFPARNKGLKNGMRCKFPGCSRKSMFLCRKCEVYLCITSKNEDDDDCFYAFHH